MNKKFLTRFLLTAAIGCSIAPSLQALATLKFGTGAWNMDVRQHPMDHHNGWFYSHLFDGQTQTVPAGEAEFEVFLPGHSQAHCTQITTLKNNKTYTVTVTSINEGDRNCRIDVK